jgi:hypothetical protein
MAVDRNSGDGNLGLFFGHYIGKVQDAAFTDWKYVLTLAALDVGLRLTEL